MACCVDAARCARSCWQTLAPSLRELRAHRRLQPGEREVEVAAVQQRPRQVEGRRHRRTRPAAPAPARPGSPGPSAWPTCRRPRRPHRRWSRRAVRSAPRRPPASAACARPRPAARRTGTAGGSADRNGDSRCPSRWCTPSAGRCQRRRQRAGHAGADQQGARQPRAARVGHHVDVGQRAAGRGHHLPHQRHARAGCGRARRVRAPRRRRPGACRSGCAARGRAAPACPRRRRSTSATPVSSQDDSMPRTFMRRVYGAAAGSLQRCCRPAPARCAGPARRGPSASTTTRRGRGDRLGPVRHDHARDLRAGGSPG